MSEEGCESWVDINPGSGLDTSIGSLERLLLDAQKEGSSRTTSLLSGSGPHSPVWSGQVSPVWLKDTTSLNPELATLAEERLQKAIRQQPLQTLDELPTPAPTLHSGSKDKQMYCLYDVLKDPQFLLYFVPSHLVCIAVGIAIGVYLSRRDKNT